MSGETVHRPALQILIPTFNRAEPLSRNLALLEEQIREARCDSQVEVCVSDNASSDGTTDVLRKAQERGRLRLRVTRQNVNVGLEANAAALLRQADAPHVMYIGDDDFLPSGYLSRVMRILDADRSTSCIIPGFSNVFPDGRVSVVRREAFGERTFQPGYRTLLRLSALGHQMSGLVFRREGLAEAYLRDATLRNIYLFIFFVGYSVLRGCTWYLPKYSVLVTEAVAKDWRYDDAGLLPEIAKNYSLLFPASPLRRSWAIHVFLRKQSWRLGMRGRASALKALLRSRDFPLASKILLPVTYASVVASRSLDRARRSFQRWSSPPHAN